MNVFGAFTFGSLIKTFLPGMVWLVALLLIATDLHGWLAICPAVWPVPVAEQPSALIAAVPVAILLGLLSNVVVFMGVNDALVRRPFARRDADLAALYRVLTEPDRRHAWRRTAGGPRRGGGSCLAACGMHAPTYGARQ